MAELKTKKTEDSVDAFLKQIPEEQKRNDAYTILKLMEESTGTKGKMWGTSIIGFGDNHLIYDNRRELDWFIIGFSPRKQNFALYISGVLEKQKPLLEKLGKYKIGKGCLYVNRLSDIDIAVLKQIIDRGLV